MQGLFQEPAHNPIAELVLLLERFMTLVDLTTLLDAFMVLR